MRAYLHLENGDILEGERFGARVASDGEVVFSTAMTGYPESLTDPSFAGQILVFTYPLIGNYGVPKEHIIAPGVSGNFESLRVWVRGVVVSQCPRWPSHYEMAESIDSWLKKHEIPGIAGVDTRALTQKIRDGGTLRGKITRTRRRITWDRHEDEDLVAATSIPGEHRYEARSPKAKHIVLIDCGVKHGILRALFAAGFTVTRVPYDTDPLRVTGIDGVVCSNGPGDPKRCRRTIEHIRRVLDAGIPFLGICLGHQLLALAVGADTYKLPYGHRGLNQPCSALTSGKAYITSQNHGYAVDKNTIPNGFSEWFVNLNDGTTEGLINERKKIWSVQFHPEGHPGPADTGWIIEMFREAL